MISQLINSLFNRTLNSVVFGISLMVLVAGYIAVGSGFAGLREHFEMNEMQFFNAWPLKMLMLLLVVNLMVVTWTRIPFTPPRYGVWCIHAGIVVLIAGMAFHYRHKVEGTTRILAGQSVEHFYDQHERMLFVKADGRLAPSFSLPSLPRFKPYADEYGNAHKLEGDDLRQITPRIRVTNPQTGESKDQTLAEAWSLPKPLTLDVVGYYPYATIRGTFLESPTGTQTGVKLSMASGGQEGHIWLVGDEPQYRQIPLGNRMLEHRHVETAAMVDALKDAATRFHRIEAKVAGAGKTLDVEIGKTYAIDGTGYSFTVESFNPAFPMSGTGEIVKTLTLLVRSADKEPKEFRRMILAGKDLQTDFQLNVAGAGPMGKRQTEPLNTDLVLLYTFNDPFRLMPAQSGEQTTLVTSPGSTSVLQITTKLTGPGEVAVYESGTGEFEVGEDHTGHAHGPNEPHDEHDHSAHVPVKLRVQRSDRLSKDESVVEVPKGRRRADQQGLFQVLLVRASMGSWQQIVPVPYQQYTVDDMAWSGPTIQVPDTNHTLQLQLGNTWMKLPARLTLEKFELVHYPGGNDNSGMFRDFKSTVRVEDLSTGEETRAVAHMNNPIYFGGNDWLFFQAAWDPEGQRFTILGVGTRPAVWTMILGCAMIFVGLMYAFYLKPVIIRRMKQKALAAAAAKKQPAAEAVPA